MQIDILTCGGTIDKIYSNAEGGFTVFKPLVGRILIRGRSTIRARIREICRKDSLDLTDADRAVIRTTVARCKSKRVVITHGTDTLVQTALDLVRIPHKTIVLTGALQPAGFADSDAAFNVGMAMGVVQVLQPGVYIVANGRVFRAGRVRKNSTSNRFEAIGRYSSASRPAGA